MSSAAIRAAWLDRTLSSEDAARSVGLSRVQFWKRAKALGLPPRPRGRRFSVAECDLPVIREMWERGVPRAKIAQQFGLAEQTPSALARRFGWSVRRRPRKINGRNLETCKSMWISGVPVSAMAKKFGVTRRTISDTATRESWTGRVKPIPKMAVSLENVRAMWEAGVLIREMVLMTGRSEKTLRRIASRIGWASPPGKRRLRIGSFLARLPRMGVVSGYEGR